MPDLCCIKQTPKIIESQLDYKNPPDLGGWLPKKEDERVLVFIGPDGNVKVVNDTNDCKLVLEIFRVYSTLVFVKNSTKEIYYYSWCDFKDKIKEFFDSNYHTYALVGVDTWKGWVS